MRREILYLRKIVRSNFTRLPFPHKITYFTTYRCNLKCRMCNIWKKPPSRELDLGEIRAFFEKSNRFSWVGLTGGESFLREDITEIAKIILNNCRELSALHFATNGTLTDKIVKTVSEIITYKDRRVRLLFTLSIDGYPSLHDEIRGIKDTWSKCVATFKELRSMGVAGARLGITLSRYNFDKMEETISSLKTAYPALRFDDLSVNIFQKSTLVYANENMPTFESRSILGGIDTIQRLDNDSLTVNNFLRRTYLRLYKKYLKYGKCPLKCQALSASCLMEPSGDIYPCSVYAQKVANISDAEYDLGKLWSSPYFQDLSKRCARGMCPSCWTPCDAYSAITGSLWRPRLWWQRK